MSLFWPDLRTFISLICAVMLTSKPLVAAIECAASVQSALDTITANLSGINFPCCRVDRQAKCRLTDGDCVDAFPDFASCISSVGSVACGISYSSPIDGIPCAAYKGTVGPFGVSPVASGGLQFALDDIVQSHWPRRLGLDDSIVLCCLDNNGPCHTEDLFDDDINPCDEGEYELFCVGDATHGMCSVRDNTRRTREIGQFFRINFDPEAKSSSSASSGTTPSPSSHSVAASTSTRSRAASTTPSHSSVSGILSGGSTTSENKPSPSVSLSVATQTNTRPLGGPGEATAKNPRRARKQNLALVVALPVVLGLLLLGSCILLFLQRRRWCVAQQLISRGMDPVPVVASTPADPSGSETACRAPNANSQNEKSSILVGSRIPAALHSRRDAFIDGGSSVGDDDLESRATSGPPAYSEI